MNKDAFGIFHCIQCQANYKIVNLGGMEYCLENTYFQTGAISYDLNKQPISCTTNYVLTEF